MDNSYTRSVNEPKPSGQIKHLKVLAINSSPHKEKWPLKFIELLIAAKENKERYHGLGVPIPSIIRASLEESYDEFIRVGLEENPPPIISEVKRGRKKKGFVRNLLERLWEWKKEVLRFIDNPSHLITTKPSEIFV